MLTRRGLRSGPAPADAAAPSPAPTQSEPTLTDEEDRTTETTEDAVIVSEEANA
eukprot:CAMPEP_0178523950 /NCGR_PEP_ID=MMETSP0696-20121128/29376_1 /TAXON_ID=265572 /ORGANISM="Extubocellulus spinifer, Strain CCMP396" /LENGTH=53 /DNA_ID=CAMNT_0020155239 /DNA_START=408 /DNA_END=566 /DNA_ORIENTATION=-